MRPIINYRSSAAWFFIYVLFTADIIPQRFHIINSDWFKVRKSWLGASLSRVSRRSAAYMSVVEVGPIFVRCLRECGAPREKGGGQVCYDCRQFFSYAKCAAFSLRRSLGRGAGRLLRILINSAGGAGSLTSISGIPSEPADNVKTIMHPEKKKKL